MPLVGWPRVYPVLGEDSVLALGGVKLTCKQAALKYKPIIRQRSTWPDQPFKMKYEVFEEASGYTIRYHVMWLDETHPIRPLNFIYRPFRILYYGSAIDIERIEVSVDKNTGKISTLTFDTEPPPGNSAFPTHGKATLNRKDHKYILSIDNGEPVEASPNFRGDRVEILVSSWNHEFAVSLPPSGTRTFDPPLEYLDDHEYVALRYATRIESNSSRLHKAGVRILVMCWFTMFPLVILLSRLQATRGVRRG